MSEERSRELQQLCVACGACCNGAIFAFVELEAGEVGEATRRRLHVFQEAGGERFKQPCRALGERGCEVYADRPAMCRAYYCDVYAAHEAEGGELEPRLAKVRRIRELYERIRARSPEGDGQWLPAPIAEIAQWDATKIASLRETVGEETLLDIAELGMRVRRDLGHVREADR